MNTDDLIDFLSTRVEAVDPGRQDRILGATLLGAFALSATVCVALVGVRPDIGEQLLTSPPFLLKIGFIVSLIAIALAGLSAGARAGTARPGVLRLALVPLAALWIAAAFQLASMPPAHWGAALIMHDGWACFLAIPLLSLIPLGVLTLVLREAAPTQLPYCGALLGLLAGGIGALAYATVCVNDAPFYVGVWYAAAIAFVVGVGRIAGPRLLRW